MTERRDAEVVDVLALSSSTSSAPAFNLPPPGGGFGANPPGGMGITSQGFGQEGYVLDSSDEGPMPRPRPDEENFTVGVPYFLPFSTPYRDSWEIFRDDAVTIRQLQSMRRQDGQARALYRLITMPIIAALKSAVIAPPEQYEAPAGVSPPGQPGPDDASAETEYTHNLFFLPASSGGMTHTFSHFVRRMLLATFDGFSAFEMVYWVPKIGPMKNKIALRKIDWRPSETLTFLVDGQGEFNGFRQRCFTYDVQILQLDGTSVQIGDMVRRHQDGQEQWVYSCTEDGKVVPGKVAGARKTGDSEPLVEVELDNGEKVKCTLTHPWMLRDGTYKRAANLKPGDSLMPLYRSYVRPSSASRLKYEKVLHPGTGRVEWTHSMVSRNLGFAAGRGHVIHHGFNGSRHLNNDPRNLRRLTKKDVRERLGCSQDVINNRLAQAGWVIWKNFKWSLVRRDQKWARKTAAPVNHKVAAVRFDVKPEAVYDIEIEDYHNFALKAGVFVHNTFFQGRTIDVKIPRDRAFYFANSEEERPFYGISLFESAFYHYDKKVKLYFITHLAAQRAAVGTRIGTMPPNPAAKDKVNFVNALKNLGMTQYMVVPSEDWTVTSLTESQGSSFDYLGLINHHNSQMSKSVLAAWFDDDTGKGKSESTLVDFGTQNDETFMMMETAIMDDIASRINQYIIPRFIDWNFGSGRYPQFKFGSLTEDQQSAVQDTFDKLAAAPPGTISSEFMLGLEKKMSKVLGLDLDYASIEQKASEDADLQRKATQASLKFQAQNPGGPPPAAPGAGQSAGGNAGGSAGKSKPSSSAKLSMRDTALVGLVGDVLVDVMRERAGDDLDE
jgi:intein-like protein with splicing domain